MFNFLKASIAKGGNMSALTAPIMRGIPATLGRHTGRPL